ncbi:MAG: carbohydrate ABC transporter permease [Nanoarchaeota archaeon]
MKKIKSLFKLNLNFQQRNALMFYVFTSPFIIGFIFLFAIPVIQAIIFSINELSFSAEGFDLSYTALNNYQYSLFVDPNFIRILTEEFVEMVSRLPLIIIFSFFAAALLNSDFKGRTISRAIFFLPVILSAGVIAELDAGNEMADMIYAGTQQRMLTGAALEGFFQDILLPSRLIDYIISAADNVSVIVRSSGVQILIFLAALQSIPKSLYESAKVEGASEWENFWLITFPLVSPFIITNIVYTIIDILSSNDNDLVQFIRDISFSGGKYSVGTSMSIIYFALVFILLIIVVTTISRYVFYQE